MPVQIMLDKTDMSGYSVRTVNTEATMKAEFTKYGPKQDYRGAHVVLKYGDRTLLGTIHDVTRDEVTGCVRAHVRHFCGDDWPIIPALRALEILERTYEEVVS